MDLTIQISRISVTLTLDIYAVTAMPEFFVLDPFLKTWVGSGPWDTSISNFYNKVYFGKTESKLFFCFGYVAWIPLDNLGAHGTTVIQ